ncbi:hypothetical protein MRB53_001238 [Persea americana]|uniref:Uncharacterized protein n=1 Tax=Persea americana TaxID=3435 RepID=A0ACC2MRZ8_PERAE|nr:hypothetical protein MRB53_001238 [Persea americana]
MAAETGEHQVMAESNAGHCRQEDWPVTREKGGRLLMMCVEWPVAAAGGMADYCAQKGLAGEICVAPYNLSLSLQLRDNIGSIDQFESANPSPCITVTLTTHLHRLPSALSSSPSHLHQPPTRYAERFS